MSTSSALDLFSPDCPPAKSGGRVHVGEPANLAEARAAAADEVGLIVQRQFSAVVGRRLGRDPEPASPDWP